MIKLAFFNHNKTASHLNKVYVISVKTYITITYVKQNSHETLILWYLVFKFKTTPIRINFTCNEK